MTFRDLINEVKKLSAQISDARAAEIVRDAYEKFLNIRDWFFLRKVYNIVTVPSKSGNVTVTNGSNIVNCSFSVTSDDAGKHFFISDFQPIRIQSVDTTNNTITLDIPLSLPSGTYNATIRKLYYQLPSDCERVISITHNLVPLGKRPYSFLDMLDPTKTLTGTPVFYAEVDWLGYSKREIMFHPIPDSTLVLTVVYRMIMPKLQNDTDEIIAYPHLVRSAAQVEVCKFLYAYTGDPTWDRMRATIEERELGPFLQSAIKEDSKHKASYPTVIGPFDTIDPQNPAWLQYMRMAQTIWG